MDGGRVVWQGVRHEEGICGKVITMVALRTDIGTDDTDNAAELCVVRDSRGAWPAMRDRESEWMGM